MNSRNINFDYNDSLPSAYLKYPYLPIHDSPALKDDRSLEETNIVEKPKFKHRKRNSYLTESETIKEWWIGHVLEVFHHERYFIAHLRDMKFVESVAEFDFDSVFDNDEHAKTYLFEGSEFAFFIIIRHGKGSPITISRVEFSSPYLWKKSDPKKADELYKKLFPNDDLV